jgi:hypothetical protein
MEDEEDGACGTMREETNVCEPEARDSLKDIGVDGRMVLKRILKK